jgi:hypothetical protein
MKRKFSMNRVTRRALSVSAALVLAASCGGSEKSSDSSGGATVSTGAPTTEPAVTETPTTTAAPTTTTEAPAGPTVEIVGGVTDFPADTETIVTVTGTGFTDLALGNRPPLDGIATGVYIVVGTFDEVWQPSAGAGAGSRRTDAMNQMWAMPVESREVLDPEELLPNIFVLDADGNFTVDIPVKKPEGEGTYAIAVYPASGAINAEHEFLIPITFS